MVNKWKMLISDRLTVISRIEAHLNAQHIEMANYLILPLPMLRKILLSKEKLTDGEFKCGAHAKKRKKLKQGAYN
jgi:hypothetical protein